MSFHKQKMRWAKAHFFWSNSVLWKFGDLFTLFLWYLLCSCNKRKVPKPQTNPPRMGRRIPVMEYPYSVPRYACLIFCFRRSPFESWLRFSWLMLAISRSREYQMDLRMWASLIQLNSRNSSPLLISRYAYIVELLNIILENVLMKWCFWVSKQQI